MRSLLQASHLLLSPLRTFAFYWVGAAAIMAGMAGGLRMTPAGFGELWGLRLRGFGHDQSGVLQDAYIEMACHAWTILWLPFACFVALRPVIASYDADFERFLRFGGRSRLFLETARVLALLWSFAYFSLPFLGSLLWATFFRFHLSGREAATALSAILSCTLFVGAFAMFLASLGLGSEMSRALGAAAPFFLAALSAFSDASDLPIARYLPPGLPYSWAALGPRHLAISCALPAAFFAVRLTAASQTRWLTIAAAPQSRPSSVTPKDVQLDA